MIDSFGLSAFDDSAGNSEIEKKKWCWLDSGAQVGVGAVVHGTSLIWEGEGRYRQDQV